MKDLIQRKQELEKELNQVSQAIELAKNENTKWFLDLWENNEYFLARMYNFHFIIIKSTSTYKINNVPYPMIEIRHNDDKIGKFLYVETNTTNRLDVHVELDKSNIRAITKEEAKSYWQVYYDYQLNKLKQTIPFTLNN